ncbi:MAG: phosphate-starvation-inducible PsiE family protein [Desulfobacteraceae bacterium]|nr:phosphate-starvation-inducible PsiE family protein [Desulfobacteraceae bacterium]
MNRGHKAYGWLKSFEHAVIRILIMLMAVVILISTIELGYIVIKDILSPPIFLLEIEELLDIFGFFLLILIGIELLETIKAYLVEKVVHSEVVLEVALIAIARKVIILDLKEYDSVTVIGIAALILSIAAAYYIVRRKIRVDLSRSRPQGETADQEGT